MKIRRTKWSLIFVDRVFDCTTKKILYIRKRLQSRVTSFAHLTQFLWFVCIDHVRTDKLTHARAIRQDVTRHDTTQHERAMRGLGPAPRICNPGKTPHAWPGPTGISRKYRKRHVSLFSDWFCERYARASLTLMPGMARAGKVRSYSLQRRSPGWTPSRISDLISDLRVSILSGDWEIHFRDIIPTCNTSLFFPVK